MWPEHCLHSLALHNTRIIGINRSGIQTVKRHLHMLERQNALLAMSAVSFAQYFNRFNATPNKQKQSDAADPRR